MANISKLSIKGTTYNISHSAKSLTVGTGLTAPDYAIVSGTADKTVVTGIIGSTAAGYITTTNPTTSAQCSMSIGSSTTVNSTGGNAIGVMNTSGIKGYYYSKIAFSTKQITLSTSRSSTKWSGITLDWAVGDTISFVNDSKYPACCKITAISSNVITVDSLPFASADEVVTYSALKAAAYTPDDFTIFACYQKVEVNVSLLNVTHSRWYPRSGNIELGWAATAFGVENLVTGSGSFAAGWNNWSAGDFGVTFGRDNISGYSGLVSGNGNIAPAECGFAVGTGNTVKGDGSAAIGYGNTIPFTARFCEVSGVRNTISGNARASRLGGENSTLSNADYADAFGSGVSASGKASFVRGIGSSASGDGAVATGTSTAIGDNAVAMGLDCIATGNASIALGNKAKTNVSSSFAAGLNTRVNCGGGAAVGKYNIGYDSSLFEVGNGTSDSEEGRKNILTINSSGISTFDGTVTVNGPIYAGAITGTSLTLSGNSPSLSVLEETAVLTNNIKTTFTKGCIISSGGLTVNSGGLIVNSGGLTVNTYINNSETINGIGNYSIAVGSGTQKASGKGSIALGRGNTVTANAAVAIGNGNSNSGSSSVLLGQNNSENTAVGSVIAGYGNKAYTSKPAEGDWPTNTDGCCIFGSNNVSNSVPYINMFGRGLCNDASVNKDAVFGQVLMGRFNAYDASINDKVFVVGCGSNDSSRKNALTIDTSGNSIFNGSVLTGTGSVSASNSFAAGKNNTVVADANNSIVLGTNNIANTPGTILLGYGLQEATNTVQGITLVGKYNNVEDSAHRVFVVGCGTSNDNRKNALTISSENGNAIFSSTVTANKFVGDGSSITNIRSLGTSNEQNSTEPGSLLLGEYNSSTDEGEQTILIGASNTVNYSHTGSVAIGYGNAIDYQSSDFGPVQMLGSNLTTGNSADQDALNDAGVVIIGQYNNVPSNSASVIIANGTSSKNHNAIVVNNDDSIELNGDIYIKGTKIGPLYNHYVTLYDAQDEGYSCSFSLLSHISRSLTINDLKNHHHMLLPAEGVWGAGSRVLIVNPGTFDIELTIIDPSTGAIRYDYVKYTNSYYSLSDSVNYALPTE